MLIVDVGQLNAQFHLTYTLTYLLDDAMISISFAFNLIFYLLAANIHRNSFHFAFSGGAFGKKL
jgi:hypothetical protein